MEQILNHQGRLPTNNNNNNNNNDDDICICTIYLKRKCKPTYKIR